MRILVLSDTHNNIVRIKHLLGFVKKISADAIVHCGDWDTEWAIFPFRSIKIPTYAVLGNADEAHQEEIEKALRDIGVDYGVDTKEINLDGKKFLVSHQPGKIQANIESGEYDVVFHGHTHQRKDKFIGKTHVINPGAVHNTTTPSFAVYDTESDKVEFLDIAL